MVRDNHRVNGARVLSIAATDEEPYVRQLPYEEGVQVQTMP